MMQPTPGSRIKELREEKFWSMKELAKRVYVTPSQISRIESGEIRSINSDLLTLFADVFGVSADYILGRTTIRSQRNYDVSSLQLTEKAVRRMISGQLDTKEHAIQLGIHSTQYVGYFTSEVEAVAQAKKIYSDADGCAICCPKAHKG